MTIDRLDRTVATPGLPIGAGSEAESLDRPQHPRIGLAMGAARLAVTLVLALLAILVLLPAVIAAQVANSI